MGAIKSVLHFITIETSVARKNLFVLLRCFLCLFACLFFFFFFFFDKHDYAGCHNKSLCVFFLLLDMKL